MTKALDTANRPPPGRRLLITAALAGAAAMCVPAAAFADENTVAAFPGLADGAVPILSPTRVFLIAATYAGSRLVAVGEQGVIIYSDDAGISWRQAAVSVSVTLVDICFADALCGFAVGALGVILKTEDGGVTWVKVLDGIQTNKIMAQNAADYAQANPGTTASEKAVRRAGIFAAGGPDKPFLSVLALSRLQAVAFGAYRMAMRTDDGGKSWTDISLAIDDPVSHNLYGSAMIGGKLYVAGETGLVFCSTDGGHHFPQVTPPSQATLFGVCGTGAGGVLVYGVAGQIFSSADHGNTWTASTLNAGVDITGACVAQNKVVVTALNGEVFLSGDGGVNFGSLPAYSPAMQVNDVLGTMNGKLLLVGGLGPQVVAL